MVVLEFRMDRTVATTDDPPIVLGKLPEPFVAKMGKKLKVGAPLRFSIRDGGIQVRHDSSLPLLSPPLSVTRLRTFSPAG